MKKTSFYRSIIYKLILNIGNNWYSIRQVWNNKEKGLCMLNIPPKPISHKKKWIKKVPPHFDLTNWFTKDWRWRNFSFQTSTKSFLKKHFSNGLYRVKRKTIWGIKNIHIRKSASRRTIIALKADYNLPGGRRRFFSKFIQLKNRSED